MTVIITKTGFGRKQGGGSSKHLYLTLKFQMLGNRGGSSEKEKQTEKFKT